jgi:tetratricopeptide (TPR) repeat protein
MKNKSLVIKFSILVSFLLCSCVAAHVVSAEEVTFQKEYTYQASEADSKLSSRTIALEQAKRLLFEELGTYLESKTEVKDFQLTKDQITAVTAGIVKVNIIDEKWDGKIYYLKANITTDPALVAKSIDKLRKDQPEINEMYETREKVDKLLKEIEDLKKDMATAKNENKDQKKKEYVAIIKGLTAADWFDKGKSLVISGNYKGAIYAFSKAIEQNPKFAIAYANRGATYAKLGNNKMAIKDLKIAARLGHKKAQDFLTSKGIEWSKESGKVEH